MALATRCPNCHALFRVVADQLKLRGGLVRCGACTHVFDAISTLSYIDEASVSPAPTQPLIPAAPPVAQSPTVEVIEEVAEPASTFAEQAPATTPPEVPVDAPAEAMAEAPAETMIEAPAETTVEAAVEAAEPVALETAATTISETPAATTETPLDTTGAASGDEAAPAFLREGADTRRRGLSIVFGAGALVLLALLLAQLAVMFRAEILVRVPAARPALNQLCRLFACTVDWPARGDLLAVVGVELQAIPGSGALELTAVVRNRAAFTLALPAIELTLTDAQNRTLARKVFAPADYLGADAPLRQLAGLAAGADLTIRVAFEARGIDTAGFVVYPFYM